MGQGGRGVGKAGLGHEAWHGGLRGSRLRATLSRRDEFGIGRNAKVVISGHVTPPLVVTLASDRLAMFEFGITADFFALRGPSSTSCPTDSRSRRPIRRRCAGWAASGSIATGAGAARRGGPDRCAGLARPRRAPRASNHTALCGGRRAWRARGVDLLRRVPARPFRPARRRRATTHWRHTERLARLFPKVRVEPDVLYVDEGNVMTSAGSAAGIDLLLHLVRKDYGPQIANMFARRMVVPPHRDGGSRNSSCSRSRCAPTTASRASPTGWRAT